MRISTASSVLVTLFGLTVGLGCKVSERGRGTPPPAESVSLQPGLGSATTIIRTRLDYAKPELDLPAERLSERVDGGEAKLRKLGCRRLRLWRNPQPAADVELLSFVGDQGASRWLGDLAGTERSAKTPGDEGWIGTNALYFRRGASVVRLIADGPENADSMLVTARELDRAMASGAILQ